jgi:hypothetical protein
MQMITPYIGVFAGTPARLEQQLQIKEYEQSAKTTPTKARDI